MKKKSELRKKLYPGNWSFELVVHNIRHPEELILLKEVGINIIYLRDIMNELESTNMTIESASGASLVDLVLLGVEEK